MKLLAILCTLICMAACGDEGQRDENVQADSTVMAPEQNVDMGTAIDSGEDVNEATCSAAAAGEICVLVKIPDTIPAQPEKVSIHFFTAVPPVGPPAILGAEIAEASELARFRAGETIPVSFGGLPASGSMFLYGVLYMPGGGAQTWQTVPGVDFHGAYSWDTPIEFTGEAINLESPLTFSVYEEQ